MFSILQRSFFRFRPKTGHPFLSAALRREHARIRSRNSPHLAPERRCANSAGPPGDRLAKLQLPTGSPQHSLSAATVLPQDHCSTLAVPLQPPNIPERNRRLCPTCAAGNSTTNTRTAHGSKIPPRQAFLKTDPQDAMSSSDTKRLAKTAASRNEISPQPATTPTPPKKTIPAKTDRRTQPKPPP